MARLEYIRPYEYQEDLRLLAVIRNGEHTMFVGYGFKENAVAYVDHNGSLTKLTSESVNHSDYDVLTTKAFNIAYPFRVYVVNPDNEAGQTSNAIEFNETDQIPVFDVLVNGKSVVENQIASIDLTGKLDQIRQANKIYGTDEDGKEVVFDRAQIEGVQHVILNGSELPLVNGTVQFKDIASESKTVPRVANADQLYGTDNKGNQVTYGVASFASSSAFESSTQDLSNKITGLQNNKQDKDAGAADGSIAVMQSHQSVGSNTKLTDLLSTVTTTKTDLKALSTKVDSSNQEISSSLNANLAKDWKAVSGGHAIENHPVSSANSSIVITPLTKEEEGAYRGTPNAIVIGVPVNAGNASVAIGQSVTAGTSSVAVGINTKASNSNSSAIGASAQATGSSSAAFGYAASASQSNAVAIGPNAAASASNSVAIGYNSVATEENTVSVGLPVAGDQPASLKRIVNVADPTTAQDVATKAYVDAKTYKLPAATASTLGGVKIGSGISISNDGTISVIASGSTETYVLPAATASTLGGVKIGSGISVTQDGTISADEQKHAGTGENSIALGVGTKASGGEAVAVGLYASATKIDAMAVGPRTEATANCSTAVGFGTNASGQSSMAVGATANAKGQFSTAIGNGTKADNNYSVALGSNSIAAEDGVVSVGEGGGDDLWSFRRIINVKDPTNAQDAATKAYVDALIAKLKSDNNLK